MKFRIKQSRLASVAILLGAAALGAFSHNHGGWERHNISATDLAKHRAPFIERATPKLDLDSIQQGKLITLVDTLAVHREIFSTIALNKSEFALLIATNVFDRIKANAMLDSATSTSSRTTDAINAVGDFYDRLKPEQQAKLRGIYGNRWTSL